MSRFRSTLLSLQDDLRQRKAHVVIMVANIQRVHELVRDYRRIIEEQMAAIAIVNHGSRR